MKADRTFIMKKAKSITPKIRAGDTYIIQDKIRRLTPTECERLQGFPDGWTEKGINLKMENIISISDTQRYKCLGNAVTTTVIRAIGEKIIDEN